MSWILQCILSPDFTEKTVHSEYLFILLRETKQDLLVTIMHISNEIQWSLWLFHFVQCVTQKSSLKSQKKIFAYTSTFQDDEKIGRWRDWHDFYCSPYVLLQDMNYLNQYGVCGIDK